MGARKERSKIKSTDIHYYKLTPIELSIVSGPVIFLFINSSQGSVEVVANFDQISVIKRKKTETRRGGWAKVKFQAT